MAEFDYSIKCSDIAAKTDGLSGREISKLGVAWQVSWILNILLQGWSMNAVSFPLQHSNIPK